LADLSELKFFQTAEHDCGYIEDRLSRNIFVDPEAQLDSGHLDFLASVGFRRSGTHLYRPHCIGCNACVPARLLIEDFHPSRSQKRIIKTNKDLSFETLDDLNSDEFYDLFERYIAIRHSDGEMYPATREGFNSFLCESLGSTKFLVTRDLNNKLLSVAVCDLFSEALSAIYTFFDPSEEKRSLGVYNVLMQIQWARQLDMKHLYLGYWIKDCQKMSYKTNYKPYQLFIDNQWRTYTE
jgi:arginyl-tRNA--protein-N-Asp/Glu arginylyltransferase